MSDNPQTDLSLIDRQQRQILSEMAILRDNFAIMTAILQRLEIAVGGLADEMRATRDQLRRIYLRLR